MLKPDAPAEIVELATQRTAARVARDWPRADALRASIEAAGWSVIDFGPDFELVPTRPADVVLADRILYGGPDAVPSRLTEPDRPGATVAVIAPGGAAVVGALLRSVQREAPDGTGLVLVAGTELDAALIPEAVEIIWTARPFSPGAALQAALRRIVSQVVVVLGGAEIVVGDICSPVLDALADEHVGIVGHRGLRSTDLRRYQPAEAGEVTVLDAACYAFRRSDARTRPRPDERLHLPGSLAAWWSLTMRDQGDGEAPRRALALDLPLAAPSADDAGGLPPDHARLARRDAYRIAAHVRRRAEFAAETVDAS